MKINSSNEWDILKSVVIGRGFLDKLKHIDLSFKCFFSENLYNTEINTYPFYDEIIFNNQYITEMSEDIEKFIKILELNNIRVFRPDVVDKIKTISTHEWTSTTHPALNVRDQAIIIDNTIIESSPMIRFRYSENVLLYSIFKRFFDLDKECNWIKSPVGYMKDSAFDLSQYKDPEFQHIKQDESKFEIMWDGAQCMRFNDDIIFNVDNKNHLLGADWLQRQFPNKNIHIVNLTDAHIDSSIIPIKEGVLLVDESKYDKLLQNCPKFLKSWTFIKTPHGKLYTKYLKNDTKLASPAIDINVLSISPSQLICDVEYYNILQPLVKPYNIECIPTPMRHAEIFGGSFHCLSLDLERCC